MAVARPSGKSLEIVGVSDDTPRLGEDLGTLLLQDYPVGCIKALEGAHSLGITSSQRLMPDARCNAATLGKLVIWLTHGSPAVEPVQSVYPSSY